MEKLKQFVTGDGRLTWTMTTNGYKYYTMNLSAWLAKSKTKLAIICCDKESEVFFRREGYPCVRFDKVVRRQQIGIAAFGTEEFKVWNRAKVDILRWIAENADSMGIKRSLYLDGDIVVARDPWADVAPGLWFQCDCGNADDHTPERPCKAPCSGVIFADHTDQTSKDTLVRLYTMDEPMWKSVKEQDQPYIGNRLELFQIPYGILPRSLYGNGKWQMSYKWKNDPWVLLHYNYRVGDTKKVAIRNDGHWIIPY